ncbi:MAG: hypothetical protein AAGC58_12630 [Asticcacaulis sp.]
MDGNPFVLADQTATVRAQAVAKARLEMATAMIVIFDLGGGMAEVIKATDAARSELGRRRAEALMRAGWVV